jgi:hypothetical protein
MKNYKQGIIFGVLSIISGLLLSGIPFGTNVIEIINAAVLVLGVITLLIIGISKRRYTASVIEAAVYLVVLFVLTMIIELNMSDFVIVGVGFVPGLSMAVTGLITSMQQQGNRKVLAGIMINSIGILISIISLGMSVMNGFIIR